MKHKDAIKCLQAKKTKHCLNMLRSIEPEHYDTGIIDALEFAIETLEKTRWIPCSLAKPINSGNYLVTSKGSTWVAEWYNDTWWGIELETRWTDVEAWMPLPEPYKAGDPE